MHATIPEVLDLDEHYSSKSCLTNQAPQVQVSHTRLVSSFESLTSAANSLRWKAFNETALMHDIQDLHHYSSMSRDMLSASAWRPRTTYILQAHDHSRGYGNHNSFSCKPNTPLAKSLVCCSHETTTAEPLPRHKRLYIT